MKNRLLKILGSSVFSLILVGGFFNIPRANADPIFTQTACSTESIEDADWSPIAPFVGDNGYYNFLVQNVSGGDLFVQGITTLGFDGDCIPVDGSASLSDNVTIGDDAIFGIAYDPVSRNVYRVNTNQTYEALFQLDVPFESLAYSWNGISTTSEYTSNSYVADYTYPDLSWQQPNFRDNFTSPDFEQWWLCVDIPNSSNVTDYYVTIDYTEVSTLPTYDNQDDTRNVIGLLPTYDYDIQECMLIDKQVDLTPDEYQAVAKLYNQDDEQIAESETISFTITAGSQVQVPVGDPSVNSTNAQHLANCENHSNPIRKIGCQLLVWAFFPDTDNLYSQFEDFNVTMSENFPFNFPSSLITALEEASLTPNLTLINSAEIAVAGNEFTMPAFTLSEEMTDIFDQMRPTINLFLFASYFVSLVYLALRFFRRP